MFPRVRLRFRQFVLRTSVLCTSTHDLIGRWFDYIWFFVVSKDRLRLWLRLKAGAKIGQHHQRHLTTRARPDLHRRPREVGKLHTHSSLSCHHDGESKVWLMTCWLVIFDPCTDRSSELKQPRPRPPALSFQGYPFRLQHLLRPCSRHIS